MPLEQSHDCYFSPLPFPSHNLGVILVNTLFDRTSESPPLLKEGKKADEDWLRETRPE